RRRDQHGTNDEGVDLGPLVTEHLVGAAADDGAEMAMAVGIRLLDEAILEHVADERLDAIVEVAEENPRRRFPGRYGSVALVDEFDDADVTGEDQRHVIRIAHADETLAGAEGIDQRRVEGGADRRSVLGEESLAGRADRRGCDPQTPRLPFYRQAGEYAG